MKNKKVKKAVAIVALAWACIFAIDFVRVSNFERPVFSVLVNGADDGGSGTYAGLGYWTEIEGNFVTEDVTKWGVTQYDMKLLGIRVQAAIRCPAGYESDIYSQEDIGQAVDIVTKYFYKEFEGCDLTALWYDEDFSEKQAVEWAEQYEAEEAIVLLSSFKVDASGGDGSLNPNSTYNNWNWVLVRSGGEWELKTWGY